MCWQLCPIVLYNLISVPFVTQELKKDNGWYSVKPIFVIFPERLVDNFKIRYVPMSYELKDFLLNLNYKFDKVAGYIRVYILNHYSFKDKLKLSLKF